MEKKHLRHGHLMTRNRSLIARDVDFFSHRFVWKDRSKTHLASPDFHGLQTCSACSLRRRVHLELFDAPSATRSVGMRWELLARGELLKLILAYLRTTSYLKLLAASRQVQEDFARHWSYELDLTNLKSRGGLQSFHKFLALPRWKGAKILRMPKDDQLGLSYRWPNSSMSHIMTCLPNLQELDLLSFGFSGSCKMARGRFDTGTFCTKLFKVVHLEVGLGWVQASRYVDFFIKFARLTFGVPQLLKLLACVFSILFKFSMNWV